MTAFELLETPNLVHDRAIHDPDPEAGVAAAASPAPGSSPAPDPALRRLGHWLMEQGYEFVCPTPETLARVNGRSRNHEATDLRGIFGWNLPFRPAVLPRPALDALREADALERIGDLLRSRVRYASLGGRLFVHSAFPTTARDAVFFGPDTYRFAEFIRHALAGYWPWPVHSLADIGCGSGAGAIAALDLLDGRVPLRVVLSDLNPLAVQFAATNLAINRVGPASCVCGDSLAAVTDQFDLIITNPPYMMDRAHRTYRDGGVNGGVDIAKRFLRDALPRLAPGGRLLMYTGTPVINGQDLFRLSSLPLLEASGFKAQYREIDPDVFGGELDLPDYAKVDRIATVGLLTHRPGRLPA